MFVDSGHILSGDNENILLKFWRPTNNIADLKYFSVVCRITKLATHNTKYTPGYYCAKNMLV